jgi:uncharacterized protein
MKIVFDTNIWISFAIGKKLSYLNKILLDRKIKTFVCDEMMIEFYRVASSSKLSGYLTKERISETIQLIKATTEIISIHKTASASRDSGDNYLLDLSQQIHADYLVTGDKDLLVLKEYKGTKIMPFSEFSTRLR